LNVPTRQFHYYDHFLQALETLLVARGVIAHGELIDRVHAFEDRPEGHDHTHPHEHDHHHHHVSERRIIGVELRDLTQPETDALLHRDVSACLAFIDAAGYPRQVPCWFLWDGEAFYVTSVAEKFHVKRLQADARASICVELEERTESGRTNRQVKGVGRVEIFADEAGE
jgi:hypothetical protein